MNAMIDTLKTAKAFEDAGFGKAQAATLAISASREDLVTKEFLRSELAILRGEFRGELSGVRTEIVGVKNEMIRWLLGSQVLLVVMLAALANFTKVFG